MAVSSPYIFNTQGIQLPKDAFVVIVRTIWNASVVDELEKGCVARLKEQGVRYSIINVPGAFEIPFMVNHCWASGHRPNAFITLGCVIRGGTPHFDYVCDAVTSGVSKLNLTLPVPVIFGVLTVDDEQQAKERTGGIHGHKGEEAAATAIQMIALAEKVKDSI